MVLNESSEALGSRSEIVRILLLAMTTADDGVGGSNSALPEKLLLVFRCFANKMVLSGFAKSKAINFSFKDYFDRSICNFQRLSRQKTLQIRSSSRLCSMRALGSTQRNRFPQTSLSKVCSLYWQKYKSQIVRLCSFNNF